MKHLTKKERQSLFKIQQAIFNLASVFAKSAQLLFVSINDLPYTGNNFQIKYFVVGLEFYDFAVYDTAGKYIRVMDVRSMAVKKWQICYYMRGNLFAVWKPNSQISFYFLQTWLYGMITFVTVTSWDS